MKNELPVPKQDARGDIAGYFSTKASRYLREIRINSKEYEEQLLDLMPFDQVGTAYQTTFNEGGRIISRIYSRVFDSDKKSNKSEFSDKINNAVRNLEEILRSTNKDSAKEEDIKELLRENFEREEFRKSASEYLSPKKNSRTKILYETENLFTKNLIDKIVDGIWPEITTTTLKTSKEYNPYFLVKIDLR